MAESVIFYLLSGLAVGASALVIGQRNPMYSVLLLIASFGALAGLYIQLDAPFVAVAQIIIYAGAIMVLFLFVVMLLNAGREDVAAPRLAAAIGSRGFKVGALLSLALGIELLWALSRLPMSWFAQDAAATAISDVGLIGVGIFRNHVFAFEATSILILVAMVGAVVIARKERP